MPTMTVLMEWVTWFFEKGLAAFAAAWSTSKQATEIALVGAVVVAGLMYFGFVRAPRVPAEIPEIDRKIAAIDERMSALATKADIEALRAELAAANAAKPKGTRK